MLNNIGPMGLIFLMLIISLPVLLIVRSSKRKSEERARIADALEKIAKSKD
jgi:hypothetical protein